MLNVKNFSQNQKKFFFCSLAMPPGIDFNYLVSNAKGLQNAIKFQTQENSQLSGHSAIQFKRNKEWKLLTRFAK